MDAFSMRVLPPVPGDPAVAGRIRELALGYLTPPEDIGPQDDEMRKLVEKYRAELEALRQGPGRRRENQASPPAPPKPANRRNQRSRRQQQQPEPGPEPGAEGEPGDDGEPGDEERGYGWEQGNGEQGDGEPVNGEPDGEGEAEE